MKVHLFVTIVMKQSRVEISVSNYNLRLFNFYSYVLQNFASSVKLCHGMRHNMCNNQKTDCFNLKYCFGAHSLCLNVGNFCCKCDDINFL